MYVQYSGGQLPYYAQPAQYQPAYASAITGSPGVQPQPVQSVQMPQQYPATYSGFSGGTYVPQQATPSPYGQPQFAQYGLQPQAQAQPQYTQLQYQPQVQPQMQHALPSGMLQGAYGQVMHPAGQPAYMQGYAKPGEVPQTSVQVGAQRVGTNLTQVTSPEADEEDDPNRLPTFVKVRGLPAEHDPRIARRPRPKKRAPGICCA